MDDETQDGGQTATADWQSDPDFHALPMPEKHKVLMELDSDYKALPGSEQVKALNTIHYGDASKEPQSWFSPGWGTRATKGVVRGVANVLAVGGAGVDALAHPGSATMDLAVPAAEQAAKSEESFKQHHTSEGLGHGFAAALPAVGPWAADIGEGLGNRDIGAATEAAVTIGGGELGEHATGLKTRFDGIREPSRISSGRTGMEQALDTPPGPKGTRAAKMKEDVHAATADLAEIEKDTPAKVTWMLKRGKGADSFRELAEKIDARQDAMWDEGHKPGIDRHAEAPIDAKAVRSAGESVLRGEAVENAPDEAKAANTWLDSVSRERGVKSADQLIREINADMKDKAAANQPYSTLQTRVRKAVVEKLRSEVDRVLDESGEKGVKEVNRRWGALENIKVRLRERAVAEARTEAKQGPLPEWAKTYAFLHPDAAGLALGVGVNAAKALKPNSSSKLTGAMRSFGRTSLEAPYAAEPPQGWGAPPVGLLNAPATPPVEAPYRVGEDASGALSRDEAQGRWTTPRGLFDRYPEMRPEKLLPAPPAGELTTNRTAPDDSRALAVDPQTHVERGEHGKMQRVYEGVGKPNVIGHTADGGPIYEATPPAERAEQAISHQPLDKVRGTRGAKREGVKGGNGERRSSIRDVQGPDLMRTARAQQLRGLLADPSLPDADRAIIEAQLEDLKAHPFERHEGGDINSMKARKTVSREEAERTTEKRKEGRKKRFSGNSGGAE